MPTSKFNEYLSINYYESFFMHKYYPLAWNYNYIDNKNGISFWRRWESDFHIFFIDPLF